MLAQPGQNKRTGGELSPKSITEHHRLISTVLDQAEKEGLVPFNVAGKATLPKRKRKEILPAGTGYSQLGHTKPGTTDNFYAHLIEEEKSKASECIADVMLRQGKKETAR